MVLLCAAAWARAGVGDVVHLVNGRTFENVVARVIGSEVEIRFDFGELRVPAASVARVESAQENDLTDFDARWTAIAREASDEVSRWLQLARWAGERGLGHAAVRAAKRAADLAPTHPGVSSLLPVLGYLVDEASGVWLPRDEVLARRGWVRWGADFVSPEQAARLRAIAEDRERARSAERREARLQLALETLVLAEGVRESRPSAPDSVWVVSPLAFGAPWTVPAIRSRGPASRPVSKVLEDLSRRIPGSLLPVGEPERIIRSSVDSGRE